MTNYTILSLVIRKKIVSDLNNSTELPFGDVHHTTKTGQIKIRM